MGGRFTWDCSKRTNVIKNLHAEKGAVLFDLLLGLCFSLIIITTLQQLSGLLLAAQGEQAEQAELQYSARMALACIQRDLRCARDFQTSADGSKLIITDADGNTVRIFVQSHCLYRRNVSTIPVAENLLSVQFSKSSAGLQGILELQSGQQDYRLPFYCFARAMQAQQAEAL